MSLEKKVERACGELLFSLSACASNELWAGNLELLAHLGLARSCGVP